MHFADSRGISKTSASKDFSASFDKGFIRGMGNLMATELSKQKVKELVAKMPPFFQQHHDSTKPTYGLIAGSHRLSEVLSRMETVCVSACISIVLYLHISFLTGVNSRKVSNRNFYFPGYC